MDDRGLSIDRSIANWQSPIIRFIAKSVDFQSSIPMQFYGMREFAITDPDGHLITFAERVAALP
jgi:hypothetical protein